MRYRTTITCSHTSTWFTIYKHHRWQSSKININHVNLILIDHVPYLKVNLVRLNSPQIAEKPLVVQNVNMKLIALIICTVCISFVISSHVAKPRQIYKDRLPLYAYRRPLMNRNLQINRDGGGKVPRQSPGEYYDKYSAIMDIPWDSKYNNHPNRLIW